MNASATIRKIVALGVVSVLLATSGCIGGFGDSAATSGDISIRNDDDRSHEVVIHGGSNGEISRTVAANSSQIVSIHDRPGKYEVNVTVDGRWHDNTTIEYYAAGENGEKLGGPSLELWIEPDGRPNLAVAYD